MSTRACKHISYRPSKPLGAEPITCHSGPPSTIQPSRQKANPLLQLPKPSFCIHSWVIRSPKIQFCQQSPMNKKYGTQYSPTYHSPTLSDLSTQSKISRCCPPTHVRLEMFVDVSGFAALRPAGTTEALSSRPKCVLLRGRGRWGGGEGGGPFSPAGRVLHPQEGIGVWSRIGPLSNAVGPQADRRCTTSPELWGE